MTEEVVQPTGDETTDDSTSTEEVVTATTETPSGGPPVVEGQTTGDTGATAKTALEAISEGIDGAFKRITPKSEETPEAKAAALESATQAAAKEDADAAEKGQVRGADGKFRAMTPEEKAAKEAAATAKPDSVNDPIPKDLNARTAERMKDLVDTVKAQRELADQHNALFGAIKDTGATPDEFASMISYMKASHSDDPKMLEAAYSLLQSELKGLAVRLGKPIAEVNLLRNTENADLVKEVQDGKLTLNRAHELAAIRARDTARAATTTKTNEATETAAQAERATESGRADLNALEDQLVARDGAATYKAKYDILVPALQEPFQRIHPSQWKALFAKAYENLKMAAPPPPPPPPPRQMPMRPKSPAGGGSVGAPKSALEAISQAIDGV